MTLPTAQLRELRELLLQTHLHQTFQTSFMFAILPDVYDDLDLIQLHTVLSAITFAAVHVHSSMDRYILVSVKKPVCRPRSITHGH